MAIPGMYKSHSKKLISIINEGHEESSKFKIYLIIVSDSLEALAQLTHAFPEESPNDMYY